MKKLKFSIFIFILSTFLIYHAITVADETPIFDDNEVRGISNTVVKSSNWLLKISNIKDGLKKAPVLGGLANAIAKDGEEFFTIAGQIEALSNGDNLVISTNDFELLTDNGTFKSHQIEFKVKGVSENFLLKKGQSSKKFTKDNFPAQIYILFYLPISKNKFFSLGDSKQLKIESN